MTIGVYCIQLESNEFWKTYYGSSIDIKTRWATHKRQLRQNIHDNQHLQQAWNKYGENSFEFHILEEVEDVQKLMLIENDWLEEGKIDSLTFDPDICFNIRPYADRNIASLETRKKMSETRRGNNNPMFNRSHTIESKIQMSNAKIGENNPMFGRKHTEVTKNKIRKANKKLKGEKANGAKLTEEEARFILTVVNQPIGKFREFTYEELSTIFKVSRSCIANIKGRSTWQDIIMMSCNEYNKFKNNLQ